MGDKLAQVFARQILDTTMDFLCGLLLDGLGLAESLSEDEEKVNLHKATGKITNHFLIVTKMTNVLTRFISDVGVVCGLLLYKSVTPWFVHVYT